MNHRPTGPNVRGSANEFVHQARVESSHPDRSQIDNTADDIFFGEGGELRFLDFFGGEIDCENIVSLCAFSVEIIEKK